MADVVCNIAKGRAIELALRVDGNDPANSALLVIPIDAGAATDDQLRDADTLSALLALVTERTSGGWNRKTLTDSSITITTTPDDTNNRYDIDLPDQTWTAVSSGAVTDVVIAYDSDTTAGTDANVVPIGVLDFAITPDGSDVTLQFNAAGFFRAS